jgi:hypothetical protein
VADLATWLADHDIPLGDLQAHKQSLEDVFLRLTKEDTSAAATRARRGDRVGVT